MSDAIFRLRSNERISYIEPGDLLVTGASCVFVERVVKDRYRVIVHHRGEYPLRFEPDDRRSWLRPDDADLRLGEQ